MRLSLLLSAATLALGLSAAAQSIPTPKVTPNTLRVEVPEKTDIILISDGVVTLQNKQAYKYGFFSMYYGRMLGGFEYGAASNKPAFSGGAILVHKEEQTDPNNKWATKKVFHILTADGIEVRLPDEVKDGKTYVDGVAALRWQHKGERNNTLNYIDANLNPVLTEFADGWKGFGDLQPRALREGMRAVYDPEAKLWGYADATGTKVLAATFKKAGDFGDGVAFVSTDGKKWGLIDKNGKAVLDETLDLGWSDPLPFSSGWAWISGKQAFIDKKGNYSRELGTASPFFDGYAFTRNSDYHFVSIDTRFNEQKVFDSMNALPEFSCPLAIAKFDGGKTALINSKGETLMLPGQFQTLLGTDGTYVWLAIDKDEYGGYNHPSMAVATLSGEILYLFDCAETGLFKNGQLKNAPDPYRPIPWPEPGQDPNIDKPKPPQPIPPVDPRTGKKKTPLVKPTEKFGQVLDPERVIVTVVADPPQGGRIAGGGTFEIGAKVPVGALPADGWAFGGFACSDKAYEKTLNSSGADRWTFTATHGGKVTVTATFYEQGAITEKHLGSAYVGHATPKFTDTDIRDGWAEDMAFDIVLDTDDKGLLAFKFDPAKRFKGNLITFTGSKDRSKDITMEDMYAIFWTPYKIEGFGEVGGQKYMYLHGGLYLSGNMPLELRAIISMFHKSKDPQNSKTDDEGSYSLQCRMYDYRIGYEELPDGTIRLGRMQVCYPGVGWIFTDEDDKMKWKFTSYLIAMTLERDERYMPSHLVEGTILHKQTGSVSIPLYPDRSWFSDDAHHKACKDRLDAWYNGTITPDEPKGWTSLDEACRQMKAHVDAWSLKWL